MVIALPQSFVQFVQDRVFRERFERGQIFHEHRLQRIGLVSLNRRVAKLRCKATSNTLFTLFTLKRFTFRKPFRTNISNFLSCLPFSHASIINILISFVSWKYYLLVTYYVIFISLFSFPLEFTRKSLSGNSAKKGCSIISPMNGLFSGFFSRHLKEGEIDIALNIILENIIK